MEKKLSYEELEKLVQELEKENHFYKCIMDAFPVNIFVKDTDCHYDITSRVCDELNGVERGGLKGMTDFDLQTSKEVAQKFYEDDIRVMKEKTGSRLISPILSEDTVRYLDIFKEPILDDDGTVMGILGMVIDPNADVSTLDKLNTIHTSSIEDYNNGSNLLLDYDITTNETMLLAISPEYGNLPNKFEGLGSFLKEMGYIDDIGKERIALLVEDIKKGKSECSRVIYYYDEEKVRNFVLVNMTAIYDKTRKPARVLCAMRMLDEKDVAEEKKKITMQDTTHRFYDLMAGAYERIIYISPLRDWYQVMVNNTEHPIKETGNFDDVREFWKSLLKSKDWEQFYNLYHNDTLLKAGKRPGINTLRVNTTMEGGTSRWKEVTIFAQPSEEDERAFIVAVADVEDDVREENKMKRHDVNKQVIDILSTIVEYRDLESGEHIRRIEALSELLLREYSKDNETDAFSEEEIMMIAAASAMHDIGKIAISDTILLKPGKLTKEEFETMKEHTVKGSEMIQTVASIQDQDYAKYCYEICRYHHERYDGKGYPDGLIGDDIPVSAQIVSIADVYDALVTKRCYKDAYAKDIAYNMIFGGECGTFSDKILKCFENCRSEIEALYA